MTAPDQVSYVYAIGRAAEVAAAGALPAGVGGAEVLPVTGGTLGALVSRVPADRFGEAGLRERLDDLAGLEAMARAHHEVVAAAYRAGVALPLRLATVYADDDRVAAVLRDREAELLGLLNRLTGHAEYGVKVYAGGPQEDVVPGAADSAAAPAGSPGRAYLLRRRAERDGRRSAQRAAGALADRVAEAASALATDRVVHRPQQGALATGPGENIANLAFLVPDDRAGSFVTAVQDAGVARPGTRVEVTGPWAPYSFATALPADAPQHGGGVADGGAGVADGAGPDGAVGRPGGERVR
ncbi:GvpL/GvpF family gas vesicle protein [Streptomyces sp. SL13]|uniref:GvpL/GvpF family gas vesicle protein n=1 Tax=Streptantibioticus silvisoli TaxID=2705255 RepID=A0AA90H181_9ACTN|nr:GvpL/GvpF family gas vesicle protein [Streptantibioticus silvisoli]MDI5969019.1 GvpL/GvpF family gas vesicle protein [Streptantibioticus silvisoli]